MDCMGPVAQQEGQQADSPPGEHCHSSNTPPHHLGNYTESLQGNLHSVVARKYQVEEVAADHSVPRAHSPSTRRSAMVPGWKLVQQEKDLDLFDRGSGRDSTALMESALLSDTFFLSQGLRGLKPLRPGRHNLGGLRGRGPGFMARSSFRVKRTSTGPIAWNHKPSSEDVDPRRRHVEGGEKAYPGGG